MTTLIFTHYGVTPYLRKTMEFAHQSNPSIRKILIGDHSNEALAKAVGWEWIDVDGFSTKRIQEFNNSFVTLSGSNHKNIKNHRNWTHYVFYRWFVIEEVLESLGINEFWHFDSDTLIIESLSDYDYLQKLYMSMMQCNSMCLNGFVKRSVVNEYCDSLISQFQNKRLLKSYQQEFEISKNFAFTEMRGFQNYKEMTSHNFVSGLGLSDEFVFDDCLCQNHGFEVTTLADGKGVKEIVFDNGKAFFLKDGKKTLAVTLNLSWLNESVIDAIIIALKVKAGKSLSEVKLPITVWLVGLARRIKKVFF